jgi:hypothetical protein
MFGKSVDPSLAVVLYWHFSGGSKVNANRASVWITGYPTEIRTRHFPDTSLQRYS